MLLMFFTYFNFLKINYKTVCYHELFFENPIIKHETSPIQKIPSKVSIFELIKEKIMSFRPIQNTIIWAKFSSKGKIESNFMKYFATKRIAANPLIPPIYTTHNFGKRPTSLLGVDINAIPVRIESMAKKKSVSSTIMTVFQRENFFAHGFTLGFEKKK